MSVCCMHSTDTERKARFYTHNSSAMSGHLFLMPFNWIFIITKVERVWWNGKNRSQTLLYYQFELSLDDVILSFAHFFTFNFEFIFPLINLTDKIKWSMENKKLHNISIQLKEIEKKSKRTAIFFYQLDYAQQITSKNYLHQLKPIRFNTLFTHKDAEEMPKNHENNCRN